MHLVRFVSACNKGSYNCMKKYILVVFSLAVCFCATGQNNTDTALNNRLDQYLLWNRKADFKEVMNFVHPSLFKLAPREQMLQLFIKTFDNDQMNMRIDSTRVINMSTDFKEATAHYRKIEYWMAVTVVFKDPETVNDPEFAGKTSELLKVGFPNSKIRFDKLKNSFLIETANLLIAVKDDDVSPWMFLGYTKNEVFIKKLFPAAVISFFDLL